MSLLGLPSLIGTYAATAAAAGMFAAEMDKMKPKERLIKATGLYSDEAAQELLLRK